MRTAASVLLVLALSGCETSRATGAPVPKERATECHTICADLGMKLGAVVIIASRAGCVCEPTGSAASRSGGSAAAGGAIIALEEEAQQQANRRH